MIHSLHLRRHRDAALLTLRGLAPLLTVLALLAPAPLQAQLHTVRLGSGQLTWESGGHGIDPVILAGSEYAAYLDSGNAPGDDVEFQARSGWISPRFFDGQTNIAPLALDWGRVSAPNSLNMSWTVVRAWLEGMVNGDHEVAYERKPTISVPNMPTFGIWLHLDFGREVGVERVRFYPRNTVEATPSAPFQDDYLRGYEVWVNEYGSDWRGPPDALVERVTDNRDPVVTVDMTPRYVHVVKLRSLSQVPFEVDEFEVYGSGYMPEATYYSDLIDLSDRSTVGPIYWREDTVGEPAFSELSVRLRTGEDDSPVLFQRRVAAEAGHELVEVSPQEYYELEKQNRADPADDVTHWSQWRSVTNGGLAPLPRPRRYVQFKIGFRGRLFDTRLVDRLEFTYLNPPLADTLRAEVFPRLAEPDQPASFRYAVQLRAPEAVLGFDQLEIDTTVPVEAVHSFTVNGQTRDFELLYSRDNAFRLAFPLLIADGDLLEFTFDLPVFRFGSTFSGRAYNSRYPLVPQQLEAGQVTDFGPGDADATSGLAVAIPKPQIGVLVGEIAQSTPVVTPNGDGLHDELTMQYSLLQLLLPAPVALDLHNLTGRRVRSVEAGLQGLGPTQVRWDGCDETGRPVPPGIYVWVLRVMADAFEERHSGTVAVAY